MAGVSIYLEGLKDMSLSLCHAIYGMQNGTILKDTFGTYMREFLWMNHNNNIRRNDYWTIFFGVSSTTIQEKENYKLENLKCKDLTWDNPTQG